MKYSGIALLFISTILIESCKKITATPVYSYSALYIPFDLDSFVGNKSTTWADGEKVDNSMTGVLIATRITGSLIDTAGHANTYERNWEAAMFSATPGSAPTDAGTVQVNGANLRLLPGYTYVHHDTSIVWDEGSVNHCSVSGHYTIPAFSADVAGAYPSYTGTLPDSIARGSDLSISFSSSNTAGADSAYFLVYYDGVPIQSNTVKASGGTATVSHTRFAAATNANLTTYNFAITTTQYYYGGFIFVVLWSSIKQTFGGKQFMFVKQRQYLGVVKFY